MSDRLSNVVLLLFAGVFIALTISSYRQKSATVDEPNHLAAGYAALKLNDYHINPEHPPLLRMWAALPLLGMRGIDPNTNSVNWLPEERGLFSHEFLYEKNNADRLLYAARFMNVLLGVLLGAILFRWARALYGPGTAVVVLALYATEPNVLAHASVVTTDLGVACFIFIAVYFLWRLSQQLTMKNLVLTAAFLAIAQVSKFSALTLWPILFALLLVRVAGRSPWPCLVGVSRELRSRTGKALAAVSVVAAVFLVSFAAVWAAYGFRYAPSPKGSGLERLLTVPSVIERIPRFAKTLNWIDDHHLLPNACTQGFLLGEGLAQERRAYLLGKFSNVGWWYYFPIAFLIKTPVALLLLFFGGLTLIVTRWDARTDNDAFLLVPVAVYMLIAMATVNLNIGVRHILPVYPFVLLIAGKAVAWLWGSHGKLLRGGLLALCLFQAQETAFAYPNYIAFFNQFVGGPSNGYKYLADSNLDWGQDLKPLKKWMDNNGVSFVNLGYFGSADPVYYGIHCSYLPPRASFSEGRDDRLQLPGYVAVSVQYLLGVSEHLPNPSPYKKLLDSEPVAVIGQSIRVYWVDRSWW
jgi:hypothetical protein